MLLSFFGCFFNKIEFIKGEIGKIFTDSFKIDKYINLDISHFNTFTNLFETDLSLSEFKDNLFYNEDYLIEMIYNIKFIKNIINKMNMVTFFKIVKLLKENKGFVKTDIQPINISSLKIYFALKRIKDICFIDISTVEKRKRTEINEDLVIKMRELFSYENYYRENKENVRLKVLNASKKQRMAIKAVDKLRNNSFDVFEWGSYDKTYEYTIIVDLFGDMGIPAKIVDILKCGEVLHRFENKPFEDVTVILGKDCTIYDKLDRKNQ